MKLKCRPDDFLVEEKLRLRLKRRGRYSVYRLEKQYWNTLDVIRELETRHRWRHIGRAGLKDRYARSVQYLSIPGPGPKYLAAKNYRLTLVGMSDEPVSRDLALGNRFTITLRALTENEAESVHSSVPVLRRFGIPNYYDDQRFGSARHRQGFIARKLVDGHYNGALKLFLATPSSADDSATRRAKQALAEHWTDWSRCLDYAPADGRAALEHLSRHRTDYKGAVKLLPRSLLELFINAYQSFLWNEILSRLLDRLKVRTRKVAYAVGEHSFYDELSSDQLRYLARLAIPVPAPGTTFKSDRVAAITAEVLESEGLRLDDLELKLRLRGLFFKPHDRAAIIVPGSLQVSAAKTDELYPGRVRVGLSFFLPPGSYATLVVKRLTVV